MKKQKLREVNWLVHGHLASTTQTLQLQIQPNFHTTTLLPWALLHISSLDSLQIRLSIITSRASASFFSSLTQALFTSCLIN